MEAISVEGRAACCPSPSANTAVRNAEAAFAQSAPPAADLVNAPDNAPSAALIGNSQAMVEVYKFISRVAEADTTVLLEGETGTGK